MTGWQTKPLGELVDFRGGGTPRRDRPDYWGGGIPWASVKDLQSQSLETTLETITAAGLANSAASLIPEGTVIIASRVGLGKVAINLKPVAINQDLKALTPRNGDLLPRYLLQFLLSKAAYFEQAGVGATVKGLTVADYQRLNVPVPPLAEQQRIVSLLDEADDLRKLRAQADRRTADLIPALFHEMFGEVGASSRWPLEPFGNLATIEATLVDPQKKEFRDLPHIGPDRIEQKNGRLLQSRSAREDGLISAKFLFDERDVLYSKIRPNLRKAALPERRGLCSADMYPVRPGTRLVREFLWAYLLTDYFTARAVELSARANMPKLNRIQLGSISVPVPPLQLQQKFAQRVTDIRALEIEQAASRARLDGLFQSMLHVVFVRTETHDH